MNDNSKNSIDFCFDFLIRENPKLIENKTNSVKLHYELNEHNKILNMAVYRLRITNAEKLCIEKMYNKTLTACLLLMEFKTLLFKLGKNTATIKEFYEHLVSKKFESIEDYEIKNQIILLIYYYKCLEFEN